MLSSLLVLLALPSCFAISSKRFDDGSLLHLAVHEDQVYIGAKNKLYQLNDQLVQTVTVTTGPEVDNIGCFFPTDAANSDSCANDAEELPNFNKILAVNAQTQQLLTCGTLYQGICQLRNLSDISSSTQYSSKKEKAAAANQEDASTVAFIAPGSSSTNVLYAAKPVYNEAGYDRYRFYSVYSILKLTGPESTVFDPVYFDFLEDVESTLTYESDYAKQVEFVSGFQSEGYNYFLYRSSLPTPPSYIAQFCQRDETLSRSFIEMPIQCSGGHEYIQTATVTTAGRRLASQLGMTEGEAVMVASFTNDAANPTQSAVCIFKMEEVRRQAARNLQDCFDDSSKVTGEIFERSKGCSAQSYQVPEDYCGEKGRNTPYSGDRVLSSDPIMVFTDEVVTAIAATVVNGDSVAFLGTDSGHIKKVYLTREDEIQIINDSAIDEGNPILSDMVFSTDGQHIFALTSDSIYKIAVQNCDLMPDCDACTGMKDPYCGWCSLQKKCTEKTSCANSATSKRWLSYNAWDCTEITGVNPDLISIPDGEQAVTFEIKALPGETPENQYECVYDDISIDANVYNEDVQCTFTSDDMPELSNDEDNVVKTVSIRSTETQVNFLGQEITFYDCTVHNKCTDCTNANWNCKWCIHSNQCLSADANCLTPSDRVTSQNKCPVIKETPEILIPNGVATTFTVNAANLPEPMSGQSGYECHVHLGEPAIIADATRISANQVRCESKAYTYKPDTEIKVASVEIRWNDNFPVEDEEVDLTVTTYKCDIMGKDCSSCLSLTEQVAKAKYNCHWCDEQCKYENNCVEERQLVCPSPQITEIHPLNGPRDGGTLLTITGSNLGRDQNQVSVSVGGVECPIAEYTVSQKIVCTVPADHDDQNGGQIQVMINNAVQQFPEVFEFKNPSLTKLEPAMGPYSGGTRLTIKGSQLSTGADIEFFMGDDHFKCNINESSITDTELTCLTPLVTGEDLRIMNEGINDGPYMKFDGAQRDFQGNVEFEYIEDPVITGIEPLVAFSSGGRQLTIFGERLHSVQQPKIFGINPSNDLTTTPADCTDVQKAYMICPAPSLSGSVRRRRDTTDPILRIGLIMDGVTTVQDLNNFPDIESDVSYVPDPIYFEFVNGKREYRGEALFLNGTNLNSGCSVDDVLVQIGTSYCEVKSLSENQLLCTPPDDQPKGYPNANDFPQVNVRIGNLYYNLGALEYVTPDGGLSEFWIIGVAIGGGILITVIIVILIIYKRKSTEAERQYKKMQIQLDTLESNVRNECKQAFAELQTEVSDFTSDLNVIGIPFWDYKAYTFKVLFPSHSDHPILHKDHNTYTSKYGGYEEGFHQFNQLMNSKHFLLIFIRTLEQQKNFGIRDKAIVASLLMIVLQDKMEYATEILKALLNELVDKSVEKKHPKLMLRRTESVVEKLVTNWLSLCMYTYLKKHAGKSLFMLYKAIKHQTEKGPIDGITSEARYSLSEDRLLREKIEPKTLTIILRSDNDDGREPAVCKVLDCDTITQAKEKALDAIYMNTPHSRRPSVYDVELMWQSGQRGHLPLKDEDVTTQTVNGWKRVNTLAHYHVPDGANMSLVQSQTKNDMVREMHGMIEITSGSSLSAITPIIMMEEGTKVYHLHKQDDNQNAQRTNAQKVISEIFLTRLLATKGTLQQYIDELIGTILRADSTLNPAVKYLFDFLDNAARRHNIVDPEVVHTWKSNSLPLRFWVNIIKNPEFVFDISKSHIVDSCLSVIAQTFMDSCSLSEHRLGKDSPSNKLLFAKDIPRYRKQVSQFYRNVQEMPPVSDRDMTQAMTELSMTNITDFNVSVALKELYKYSMQYSFELIEALDEDQSARKMHLANRFEQVQNIIEGTQYY